MKDFFNIDALERGILFGSALIVIIGVGIFVIIFMGQILTSIHGVAGAILATFTILIAVLISGIMGRREYKKKLLISNTSKRPK